MNSNDFCKIKSSSTFYGFHLTFTKYMMNQMSYFIIWGQHVWNIKKEVALKCWGGEKYIRFLLSHTLNKIVTFVTDLSFHPHVNCHCQFWNIKITFLFYKGFPETGDVFVCPRVSCWHRCNSNARSSLPCLVETNWGIFMPDWWIDQPPNIKLN